MNKTVFNVDSLAGLAVSAAAVADLICRWELAALKGLYLAWGVALAASVAIILLSPKTRDAFHAACRGGSPLLVLRVALAAALFLLGWYVNAASAQLYGDGSPMVADNGVRMFAVIFTLVFHVIYLAFTRKKRGQA